MNCYWSYGVYTARERAQVAGVPGVSPGGVVEDPASCLSQGSRKLGFQHTGFPEIQGARWQERSRAQRIRPCGSKKKVAYFLPLSLLYYA
jgi:hypothetical protein